MLISAFILACSMGSSLPAIPPGLPAAAMTLEEAQATCPVCGMAISSGKGTKVLVRGHEYTVDDAACGEKLTANPDAYLEADGTPKNAKKESKPS